MESLKVVSSSSRARELLTRTQVRDPRAEQIRGRLAPPCGRRPRPNRGDAAPKRHLEWFRCRCGPNCQIRPRPSLQCARWTITRLPPRRLRRPRRPRRPHSPTERARAKQAKVGVGGTQCQASAADRFKTGLVLTPEAPPSQKAHANSDSKIDAYIPERASLGAPTSRPPLWMGWLPASVKMRRLRGPCGPVTAVS